MEHTAATGRIRVEPMGRGAWRLCDLAHEDAGRALLAYVEYTYDGDYEAIWVAAGAAASRHPTLDEVIRTALASLAPAAESRRTKPIPIAHRSPFASR